MTDKLKVGDRLWWVPDRGEAGEVVVEKMGRKWATVGRPSWCSWIKERIDYQDERMPADGGNHQSPGRCYRNQEEWELSTRRDQLWAELKRLIYGSYQIPAHLDGDDLEDILNTLKGSET